MTYVYDKSGILDELELGDRASEWQLMEQLGALYSEPEDRARAVVTGCYVKVARALGEDHPESLRWYPEIDEYGMWVMP